MAYKLIASNREQLSPWVSLSQRTYQIDGVAEPQTYHFLCPQDYIGILPITADGRIVLVRQFRPAVELETLELPGGLLEAGETPLDRALLELTEETGFSSPDGAVALPPMFPDAGRLENVLHGFVARDLHPPASSWRHESGVEPVLLTREELLEAVKSGGIGSAAHVAIVGLALLIGLL